MALFAAIGTLGCSSTNKEPSGADCGSPPKWLNDPGDSCAIGTSGPTLNPTNSLYQAENDARVALVSAIMGVEIKSALVYGEKTRIVDFTTVDGTVPGLATRQFWTDQCGDGPLKTKQVVYVQACIETRGTDCTFGVSGPTLEEDDARTNAEEDAKLRIAEARSVRVQSATLVDTEKGVTSYQGSEATVDAPSEVDCREVKDAAGSLPRDTFLTVICCAR